jgi:hypothetical protein
MLCDFGEPYLEQLQSDRLLAFSCVFTWSALFAEDWLSHPQRWTTGMPVSGHQAMAVVDAVGRLRRVLKGGWCRV